MEQNKIQIYQTEEGQVRLEVALEQDTVWLSQEQMALLFDVQKAAISKHLKNVYISGELERVATVSKMETVQEERVRQVSRQIEYYNLDAVISVGYRIKSERGVQFRRWATQVLRQHLVQGYTLNQSRFEQNAAELKERNNSVDVLTKDFLIDSTVIVATFLIRAFENENPRIKPTAVEAFNDFWDDSYSEFEMGNYSFPASEILFYVDNKAYMTEQQAFAEGEDELVD